MTLSIWCRLFHRRHWMMTARDYHRNAMYRWVYCTKCRRWAFVVWQVGL